MKELCKKIEMIRLEALSVSEIRTIFYLVNDCNFSPDLIEFACEYSAAKKGKWSFKYVEKVLMSWKESGCKTLEDVQALVHRNAQLLEIEKSILQILRRHIGTRALTTKEEGFVDRWCNEGFDPQLVSAAIDRALDFGYLSGLSYVDKTLLAWQKQGIKTKDDLLAFENSTKQENGRTKTPKILFKSHSHEEKYKELFLRMKRDDEYHRALAYLIALDSNISSSESRVSACFDFENDSICRSVLEEPWITGTDMRILKLAFNLWNSNNQADVSDVFGYGSDLQFLLEAVKIRFGGLK